MRILQEGAEFIQEAAILIGDHMTQQIKAKAVSILTRKPTYVQKIDDRQLKENMANSSNNHKVTWKIVVMD